MSVSRDPKLVRLYPQGWSLIVTSDREEEQGYELEAVIQDIIHC